MKDKKLLFGISIVFLFLASVGFSYAYFTSTITNKDVKDQIVETGILSLRYVDGAEIVMNNIKPGDTIAKTIYVANTGTLDTAYSLVWQELLNEIENDEMVIEGTCTRMNATTEVEDGTCEGIDNSVIANEKIKRKITIEPNIVHKYDLTITFKEIGANQNYNQGKKFSGVLGIDEYVENTPIYCTFDGEMVQGAEYVNGQYTYRYMQEGKSQYAKGISWNNITQDGWGVQLTDRTSTIPVTSKVCTYINDKPVVSMAYMFANSQASEINVSSFNTSNIVNMKYMFFYISAKKLNLENFDTSNVTNMQEMFVGNEIASLDLSSFDTSKVINMSDMFLSFEGTRVDLSSFNTLKVTDMSSMFMNSNILRLDLSSFDTSNTKYMDFMFYGSQLINIDLSNFNTSNVINMESMFYNFLGEKLDLSSFNTLSVTDMSDMFRECNNLTTIYVSKNFTTDKVTSSSGMFSDSTKLTGAAGTTYDSNYTDITYARIDGGTSSPGYFTLKNN